MGHRRVEALKVNSAEAVSVDVCSAIDEAHQRVHSRVPKCPLRNRCELGESNLVPGKSGEEALRQFPEWMDLRTAQAYVSVSDRTLRDWVHREYNPLPAVQVSEGKIFISRSQLDRWMLMHLVVSGPDNHVGSIVDEVMQSLAESR